MRLDEAGSLRTEAAPSHSTVFSQSASSKHTACLAYAVKVQRNEVFKKQKTQLVLCHIFLFLFLLQLKVFFCKAKACKALLASKGKVGNVSFVGLRNVAAFICGRGVSKKKKKKKSLPTKRRFQLRISQQFPEARQPCCHWASRPYSHPWDN